MILRSLKLENIRSYTEEKINFPKGSVLLSGDIGSGKSTILLAIEFALFGILRSGLSGMSLLKHGTNKGSVELKFEIDKKEYLIKRTLKKTKTSVGQDSGYILSDGKKFEGTPIELKAKIIEILGYPEELITKSKSLIYRFTVYTAQEEMKEILFEDKDLRLDTLRKVFGIDKYKSIKENAIIFAREIKRNKSELAIRLESYDVLSEELHEKREKSKLSQDIKSKKENELDNIREIVEKEKSKLKEHEVSIKRYNEIKKNLEIKKTLTETKKNSITELTNKSREIKIKIKNLEKKLLEFSNVTELKPEKELEEYLSKIQDKYSNIIKEKFSIKEKKRIFEEQIKEIESDIKELSLKSKESILIKDKIEKLNDSIKKKIRTRSNVK